MIYWDNRYLTQTEIWHHTTNVDIDFNRILTVTPHHITEAYTIYLIPQIERISTIYRHLILNDTIEKVNPWFVSKYQSYYEDITNLKLAQSR